MTQSLFAYPITAKNHNRVVLPTQLPKKYTMILINIYKQPVSLSSAIEIVLVN